MRRVKVRIEYEWNFTEKEWGELKSWDIATTQEKVKERLEYDPVSAFYSLRNITAPDPIKVKVELIES